MESPFINDGFSLIWMAFKRLYGDKAGKVECQITPELAKAEDGEEVFGLADYDDELDKYIVFVRCDLPIMDAMEILAHELAHCAVGVENGHNEVWAKAFDDIFDEYNRIGDEMFDRKDKMTVTDGKAYIRDGEWQELEKNYDGIEKDC